MSTGWLFAVGAVVTLIVVSGVALLIYGAILDGRYAAEQKLVHLRDVSDTRTGHRPAA
jgi:hypothetical protein